MSRICLKNELSQGFEPVQLASLQLDELLLVTGLFWHKRVLEFLELLDVEGAVREGGVDSIHFRFDIGQLRLDAVNLSLFLGGRVGFPRLDPGEKLLEPFIGNRGEQRVSLHFGCESVVADERAVVAMLLLVLVGATVIMIFATALFAMALASDAIAARAAGSKIQELKSFRCAWSAAFPDSGKRGLNVIPCFLGNHGDMGSLMQFAFVEEHTVIERAAEKIADGREWHRARMFAVLPAGDSCRRYFLLNCGEGVIAGCEHLHDPFHLWEDHGVRLNGAESRLVEISQWCAPVIDTSANFLANPSADVHGQIADILVGHAEFDSDHENVVRRQVCFLKSADFLNGTALEHSDDPTAIVEVASETIQLPC